MTLQSMRKSFKAAKSRALYWSGNPSFSGHRFQPNAARCGSQDLNYEMAMDDIDSLASLIEENTGKPVKRYDPKADFIARYCNAMKKVSPKGGTDV